jgi:hypothetical protein
MDHKLEKRSEMMKMNGKWKQSGKTLLLALSILMGVGIIGCASVAPKPLGSTQFVFTSDPHYGVSRSPGSYRYGQTPQSKGVQRRG